jgi:hypothetical protein
MALSSFGFVHRVGGWEVEKGSMKNQKKAVLAKPGPRSMTMIPEFVPGIN